jgi:hypothetical protein
MTQRVNELADQFEAVHREVVAFCEGLTETDWATIVPNEQRTVGVLIQHIAIGYTAETALIRAIVTGQPLPAIYNDRAILDEANARDAVDLLPGTKADALTSLDRHARRTARYLRSLSDEDLAMSEEIGIFGGASWSVEGLIERIILGHPKSHLTGIREALAEAAASQPSQSVRCG